MSSEDIPFYVKELNVKMEFIGYIPSNHKLSIKFKKYLHTRDWWCNMYLSYYCGESSKDVCDYIHRIVETIVEVLKLHPDPLNKSNKLITESSLMFRRGIRNLINSYHDDPDASSKLRSCISLLNLKVPDEEEYESDDDAVEIENNSTQ